MALPKNQLRVLTILDGIGLAREQLGAAMEAVETGFSQDAFVGAAESKDPRKRNNVAAVERDFEVLANYLHELAARALDEGRRLGIVEPARKPPFEHLEAIGVISTSQREALSTAREMRNELAHHYPPDSHRALWKMVVEFEPIVGPYLVAWGAWVTEAGIFSFDE